jgi:hypothetical protein
LHRGLLNHFAKSAVWFYWEKSSSSELNYFILFVCVCVFFFISFSFIVPCNSLRGCFVLFLPLVAFNPVPYSKTNCFSPNYFRTTCNCFTLDILFPSRLAYRYCW